MIKLTINFFLIKLLFLQVKNHHRNCSNLVGGKKHPPIPPRGGTSAAVTPRQSRPPSPRIRGD